MLSKDEFFMLKAIDLAKKAYKEGEVPVGAIIVKNDKIIASDYNRKETHKNALCHAEILCINKASSALNNWRLTNCSLYVTLEPCIMCTGAVLNARLSRLIFGTADIVNGAVKSNCILENFKHVFRITVKSDVLANTCLKLLQSFFRDLRKKKI